MILKQKKFYNILKLITLINEQKNTICLIVHLNNMDTMQNNILKTFCDEKNIKNTYLKLNLFKKLTKNRYFLNLFEGPTKLYFFSNLESLFEFNNNSLVKEKIIPLTIYFNEKFISYSFFLKKLNEYSKHNNLTLEKSQEQIILNLNNKSVNLIKSLNNNLKFFLYFLSHLEKVKNK